MKRYRYLIFDADHTLIDFEADEREAVSYTHLTLPTKQRV